MENVRSISKMVDISIKEIILTTLFLICTVVPFILNRHQQRSYYRLKNRINNSFTLETAIVLSLKLVHLYRNM